MLFLVPSSGSLSTALLVTSVPSHLVYRASVGPLQCSGHILSMPIPQELYSMSWTPRTSTLIRFLFYSRMTRAIGEKLRSIPQNGKARLLRHPATAGENQCPRSV